jgi:hypothetical protein
MTNSLLSTVGKPLTTNNFKFMGSGPLSKIKHLHRYNQ